MAFRCVANVLGEIGAIVGDGLIDGVFNTPPTGSGIEESEALDTLAGIAETGEVGGRDVDLETGGDGREELDGETTSRELVETGTDDVDPDDVTTTSTGSELDGETTSRELVETGTNDVDNDGMTTTSTGSELDEVDDAETGIITGLVGIEELELLEVGPKTTAGDEEEVGRDEDGPVGGEVEDEDEDELLVVTLIGTVAGPELEELLAEELVVEEEPLLLVTLTNTGPELEELPAEELVVEEEPLLLVTITNTGPELEELPVADLFEEDELLVVILTGSMTAEGELVEEDEVVDPHPEIVEVDVSQDETVPISTSILVMQDTSVATHELLLAVTEGVLVTPQLEIVEVEVSQDDTVPNSSSIDVVQDTSVATHELLLIVTGGVVVLDEREEVVEPQPGIVVKDVEQTGGSVKNVVQETVLPKQESVVIGGVVVTPHPGIDVEDVVHEVSNPLSTSSIVVQDDEVAMQELLLTSRTRFRILYRHPRQ
ncbi:hypothetical protein BKA64DRAFT_747192 [Cadophora sp. MPI-SDFR-AT-0126]|nr:hypothetical protein BKA64DRAFT_747192 [Leotiomycetes sp. MPI-SDFR-AT-0126]